jgi:hypothetical protein
MKKLFSLLFIVTFLISCSKDSSSDSGTPILSDTPLAKAEFDGSNFGIYKGVIIGSTGVITINIKNDGILTATLVIDGVTSVFTSNGNVALGEAINNLTFTSGDKSFTISVTANGGDISVLSSNIPGHLDATFNVIKEYSEDLVTCYQGTYTGTTDEGVFNLIFIDNQVYGLSRSNSAESETYFLTDGTINLQTNAISGSIDTNIGTFTGTLSGNTVSGNWSTDAGTSTGTWSGTRTL